MLDLAEAGSALEEKDGRRSRYGIQTDLHLPEFGSRERMVGEVQGLLTSDALVAAS